jgi:hypothetical protein
MMMMMYRVNHFSESLYNSAPLQVSCGGRCFDLSKLIFMLLNAENGFIEFKGSCPFKIKIKCQQLKSKQTSII